MLTQTHPLRSPAASTAEPASWQLLAPGDEVSIMGAGAYEIVHLSHGRAWLCAVSSGAQRLADVSALQLRRCGAQAAAQH